MILVDVDSVTLVSGRSILLHVRYISVDVSVFCNFDLQPFKMFRFIFESPRITVVVCFLPKFPARKVSRFSINSSRLLFGGL